jgi:Ca2+-binding EF-hand superfamily protein
MSQAGRFAWDAEAAPIFDNFVMVSADISRPKVGDQCKVLAKSITRKGPATDSDKVGQLQRNDRFEVVTVKEVDGQTRLRFRQGDSRYWTSLKSKGGDWLVMKDILNIERRVTHHMAFPRSDEVAPPMIEHFCIPTAAEILSDAALNIKKPVYTFIRTLDGGERQYGFCIRVIREVPEVNGAESDTVDVLCILSRYPWFTVFGSILEKLDAQWAHSVKHGFKKIGIELLESILGSIFDATCASFPASGEAIRVVMPAGTVEAGRALQLYRPDDMRDPHVDIGHSQLFSLLSLPGIMAVFRALMSEQRVIVRSDNVERLSACMHSFVALLYPFAWSQILVPLLPLTLIDYLTAPMPFFCGIHESMMEQVLRLPTEDELVVVNLDTDEVQLCISELAELPSSHTRALEKRIRKLLISKQDETSNEMEFDRQFSDSVSDSFLDFMISVFGKYRDFIDNDFEFDVEDFTEAENRSESTRSFLQIFRGSQMFELWARERAALMSRKATDGDKFSLADYDKFEAAVELEGEYVGMSLVAKAVAKASAVDRRNDEGAAETVQSETSLEVVSAPGLVAAYHKELALNEANQAVANKVTAAGTSIPIACYTEMLEAGSIDKDTYDSLATRLEQYTSMRDDATISQEEYDAMVKQLDAENEEVLRDFRGQQAMAKAVEYFNTKGAKKGLVYFQDNWQAIGLAGQPTAENIAKILKAKAVKGGLKKAEIGELLGAGKPINVVVRAAYVNLFDFSAMSFVTCLRAFLAGFKLPGESQLIERIMADFASRYYVCNPTFAKHLTPQKVAEFKTAFAGCSFTLTDEGCPALQLCLLVKSLPGDYKYMKDDEIINDMVHITMSEVKFVAETVLQISDLDYVAVEKSMPLVEQSCSAAATIAIAEKAENRAAEYQSDVEKMEAQLAEMDEGEERTKFSSRVENNKKQAQEKAAAAVTARETAKQAQSAAEEVAGAAFVSWPMFVTMLAHKMGNDTAFVLAYSTIQLNTDAHNPKLDDAGRMTKKMFLENNRHSPDLAVLDDDFVGQLYDEIVKDEIKILDEIVEHIVSTKSTKMHEKEPGNFREACDALFAKLDTDCDRELTLKEIKAGIKDIEASTGLSWEAKQVLQEADADNDKSLSVDEFYSYLEQEMAKELARLQAEAAERAACGPAVSRKDSDHLFAQLDTDDDGKLSLREIKAGLKVMEANTGLAWEAKRVLQEADTGNDKLVDEDEFYVSSRPLACDAPSTMFSLMFCQFQVYLEEIMYREVKRLEMRDAAIAEEAKMAARSRGRRRAARAPAMSREDADALFAKLDKDGSGELSLAEIKSGLKAIKQTTELPMEAKKIMEAAPIPSPPPRRIRSISHTEVMAAADVDNDQSVTADEFYVYLEQEKAKELARVEAEAAAFFAAEANAKKVAEEAAVGLRFRVVKKANLKKSVELKGDKIGALEVGDLFVALERRGNRVRCEQGWVSILAESGNVLLEELPAERARTRTHLLQPSPRRGGRGEEEEAEPSEEEPSPELELSPSSPRALATVDELVPSPQALIQPGESSPADPPRSKPARTVSATAENFAPLPPAMSVPAELPRQRVSIDGKTAIKVVRGIDRYEPHLPLTSERQVVQITATGIGLELELDATVIEVSKDGDAARAGISIGQRVIYVAGTVMPTYIYPCAPSSLAGRKN